MFIAQTLIVKYGGGALESIDLRKHFLDQVIKLQKHFYRIILVHGGGKALTSAMEKNNMHVDFLDGIRQSPVKVVTLAQKVFRDLNEEIVNLLKKLGCTSILSKTNGSGLYGTLMYPDNPTNLVGIIDSIDEKCFQAGGIHVVSSIVQNNHSKKNTALYLNINADLLATSIATFLGVGYLLFISDVNGIYLDKENPATLVKEITAKKVSELIKQNVLEGGMKVKVCTALDAMSKGVDRVFFINGTSVSNLYQCILGKDISGTVLLK